MNVDKLSKNVDNKLKISPTNKNSNSNMVMPNITLKKDFGYLQVSQNSNGSNLLMNMKNYSYNDEFYSQINKNVVLPILMNSGASKLVTEYSQNQNASLSSTTGQYIVSNFLLDILR